MRQLDAELRRFFARRIVRGTFLVAVLLIVLVVTISTAKARAGHEYQVDTATGRITDVTTGQVVKSLPNGDQYPRGAFVGSGVPGTVEFGQSDTRVNIGNDLANVFQSVGVGLLFAAFALGASFVGAEYNVGSLTTQLLFEPRRWRVHLAKAIAVAIGIAALTLAVLAVVALALYVGSEVHGIVHGIDATFVSNRAGQALRVAGAASAGAVLAYSVTLVARRSSAGMLLFFLQFVLLNLINPVKMPWGVISHYAPLRGLIALIVHHPQSADVQERAVHTIAGGAVLTAIWVVIVFVASGAWFERSEVR